MIQSAKKSALYSAVTAATLIVYTYTSCQVSLIQLSQPSLFYGSIPNDIRHIRYIH